MRRALLLLILSLVLATGRPGLAQRQQSATAGPEQRGSTSIAGVVVNASTGVPLNGADIRVSTAGDQAAQVGETLTAANGTFRFSGLPEGKYRLYASRRGYIASGYQAHDGFSTAIVIGAHLETTDLRFVLMPYGVIDGAISDDNGDRVADAEVRLFRQDQFQGKGRIVPAGRQQSDDRGSFEFSQLRPGSYFICVAATPWYTFRPSVQVDNNGNPLPPDQQPTSPLDVAYPLTFYPNATDSLGATPIPVRGGDRLQISFSLHAVPAIHIQLHVPVRHQNGAETPRLAQDAFGTPVYEGAPDPVFTPHSSQMTFDYVGLAPGQYEVHEGQAGVLALDANSNRTVDAPASITGVGVTGKVAMASGAPLPRDVIVVARRVNGVFLERTAGIQPDGSFTLQNLAPGDYQVTVRGGSGALMVAQMAASGAEVHGNTVTVGAEPVLLAATLARGSGTIDGFVKRGNEGFGGAMVELVPDDPNAPTELIRRDQSNTDGSFTLRRVVPGNYTLVAIDNGWTLEWARRDALTDYLSRGVKVHVGDDEKLQLPGAVPLQER